MKTSAHHLFSIRVLSMIAAAIIGFGLPGVLNAQAPRPFELAACSNQEQPITGEARVEIADVSIGFEAIPAGHACTLTFTTEAATSRPEAQLMELSYRIGSPPGECTPLTPAPILTQVSGGIDETHTFITPSRTLSGGRGNQIGVAPCLATLPLGEFRIRNHCLIVACSPLRIIE